MARTYKRDKNGKFASTGGGGGSGKSLRQTVQSKRSIGSARTTYRNEKADKYAGNPSVKKTANRAKSVNRGNIPGTNARAMNRGSEQRYNKQIASTSGASSRGKSLRGSVSPNATIRTKDGNVYRNSDSSMNARAGVRRLRNSLQTGVRGTQEDKNMGYTKPKREALPVKGNSGQAIGAHTRSAKKPGEKVSRFSGATTKRSGGKVTRTGGYYANNMFKASNRKKK